MRRVYLNILKNLCWLALFKGCWHCRKIFFAIAFENFELFLPWEIVYQSSFSISFFLWRNKGKFDSWDQLTMTTKGILIMSLYLCCNSGLWFLWFYQSGYCDFDVYCRSARACISNFKLTRFVTDMSLRIEI